MKRFLLILTLTVLCLSVAGCSSNSGGGATKGGSEFVGTWYDTNEDSTEYIELTAEGEISLGDDTGVFEQAQYYCVDSRAVTKSNDEDGYLFEMNYLLQDGKLYGYELDGYVYERTAGSGEGIYGQWDIAEGGDEHSMNIGTDGTITVKDGPDVETIGLAGLIDGGFAVYNEEYQEGFMFILDGDRLIRYEFEALYEKRN